MIFSQCAPRTARASTASLRVVGEGVLCGAVSSNAHRWGALSRPNGGLFLRVPLREHLHLPAWICNCARVQRPHAGTILTRRHNALITTRQELTHTPPIGGAERRARKRASSWSARSRREDNFDTPARGCGRQRSAVPNLVGRRVGCPRRPRQASDQGDPRLSGAKERC